MGRGVGRSSFAFAAPRLPEIVKNSFRREILDLGRARAARRSNEKWPIAAVNSFGCEWRGVGGGPLGVVWGLMGGLGTPKLQFLRAACGWQARAAGGPLALAECGN